MTAAGPQELPAADWRTGVAALAAEGLAALTAVDRGPGVLELWLRTEAGSVRWCRVDGPAQSIAAVFPLAELRERELAQLFGIEFDAPASNQPLFTGGAEWLGRAPLRRAVGLARRNQTPWPGAKEPGGSPSRRRSLPTGVTDAWQEGAGEVL